MMPTDSDNHIDAAMPTDSRRWRRVLCIALVALLVSLALRLGWASIAHITPVSDFRGYDSFATHWIERGHFGWEGRWAYRTPAYPGFLALVYMSCGHDLTAAAFAQAGLGALTTALVVLLAGTIAGPRSAAIAGALHCFAPTSVAYVPVLASENLAVPVGVLAVLLMAWADRRRGLGRIFLVMLGAAAFGASMWVRPAALFFAPALLVLSAYSFHRRRISLLAPLLFVVVSGAVIAPWLVRNCRHELGPVLSTAGGINLWMGNNDTAEHGGYWPMAIWGEKISEGEDNRRYSAAAKEWILSHPRRYAELCLIRAKRMFWTEPDVWVTRYFWPTAENDKNQLAVMHNARNPAPQREPLVAAARAVHGRNLKCLERYRRVIAPLGIAAMLLGLIWWRRTAVVLLPLLSYQLGIVLTFFAPRFREMSNPLMFVLMGALLADVIFGTQDLGRWPGRWGKLALAAGAIVLGYLPKLWHDLAG